MSSCILIGLQKIALIVGRCPTLLLFVKLTKHLVNDIRVDGTRLYGPERIAEWIRSKKPKTEDAVNNADNYAWFVTGMLLPCFQDSLS